MRLERAKRVGGRSRADADGGGGYLGLAIARQEGTKTAPGPILTATRGPCGRRAATTIAVYNNYPDGDGGGGGDNRSNGADEVEKREQETRAGSHAPYSLITYSIQSPPEL
jgi:hypothetical protein